MCLIFAFVMIVTGLTGSSVFLNQQKTYQDAIANATPSSQMCYACGEIHPEMKDLSKRHIYCQCGYHNDRDMNAAMNIKREGLRMLGVL